MTQGREVGKGRKEQQRQEKHGTVPILSLRALLRNGGESRRSYGRGAIHAYGGFHRRYALPFTRETQHEEE